jgi:hypothetical protein
MEVAIQFKGLTDGRSLQQMLERLGTVPDALRYHLHMRCFAAWEFERTKVGQIQSWST